MDWWQGSTFYEIFPASFQDSTKGGDGIGDLRGITMRLDYLKGLGIRAIRLNSIFPAPHYPEYYSDISNMTEVNKELGTLEDFSVLAREIHKRNMSLILDLPLYPFVKNLSSLEEDASTVKTNKTEQQAFRKRRDVAVGTMIRETILSTPSTSIEAVRDVLSSVPPPLEEARKQALSSNHLYDQRGHPVSEAIRFWQERGVDGFYLKGLEHYVHEDAFVSSLRYWKSLLRPNGILICHSSILNAATSVASMNSILSRIDLVDMTLRVVNGTKDIKAQIEAVTKSMLFNKAAYPWILWSVDGVDTNRVASTMSVKNASLAASLLGMMLPGTASIFYGNEVWILRSKRTSR